MKIKQELTANKAEKVQNSLYRLLLTSKVMLIESVNELDADFKMPIINNFAKRIQNDCEAINKHLARSGYYELSETDNVEELAGEFWRVINILSGCSIENVKEFSDYLEHKFKKLSA